MFPYTEKYTESKSDLQNNDLLYKIDQQCRNTFEILEKHEKENQGLFCNIYKLHSSYFRKIINSVILGLWCFYFRGNLFPMGPA